MGVIITFRSDANDQLSDSTRMWENINSELLLLTFLPGLLFKDAYGTFPNWISLYFFSILFVSWDMHYTSQVSLFDPLVYRA